MLDFVVIQASGKLFIQNPASLCTQKHVRPAVIGLTVLFPYGKGGKPSSLRKALCLSLATAIVFVSATRLA